MTKTFLLERTVPGLHAHLANKVSDLDKSARVLDLGCGTGAWLARLQERGYLNLAGADINQSQLGVKGIEFCPVNLDGDGLNGIDGHYDLITAIEFIEHIGDISNLLKFVATRLAADGAFLVSTPNVNSLATRVRLAINGKLRHFDAHGDPTHFSPIFVDPFARLLQNHGLHVEKMWTYPESGTQFGSRLTSRSLTKALRLFLGDPFPGDIMCFLIKKQAAVE